TLNREPSMALTVSGLSKQYPGVRALNDVSFTVEPGTVLAVVGENGAGKSTLMKSIAGAERASAGQIEVFGTPLIAGNPRSASDAGVAMIYQELTIVPELSAQENVYLGHVPTLFGVVRKQQLRRNYTAVAERVGSDIRADARAGSLSTASQQLLEIMRAIAHGRRLVIMDEPTASLGPEDIERLHSVIRDLRAQGCSVLYVSHDLDAVLDVSDEVMVLREGSVVSRAPAAEWTTTTLVTAMLGHAPSTAPTGGQRTNMEPTVVALHNLTAPGVDVKSLSIRSGEVVGIAGLVGSGRTRLLRAVAGAESVHTGSIQLDGKELRWPASPAQAWSVGIALAPEDRKHQGLVLDRAASWNIALGGFALARRSGRITAGLLTQWAEPIARRVAFATSRLSAPAGTLSGGNQQKLLLGRLFSRPLRLMLLDEPTRGMDIGAKSEVFASMRSFADEGRAVLWSSSEIQEVLDHSDRVIVCRAGKVVAELPRGATVHDVLAQAFGTTEMATVAASSSASSFPHVQENQL
ncbi:MAG: sugar ABC transporter ATP-binding protein, partial [Salinibacterium amurskyense]